MKSFKAIAVRAENGDHLTVYEFRDKRFIRNLSRLTLCTGELVERIDEHTFAICGTGERLARIG